MFRALPAILPASLALVALPATATGPAGSAPHTPSFHDHTVPVQAVQIVAQAPAAPMVLLAQAPAAPEAAEQSSNRGWEGLARVLEALTPSIDTSAPPSASDITRRIRQQIDRGQYDDALRAIEKRKAQRTDDNLMGHDVQLRFLEGRALSAANRHDEAIAVYTDMTVEFPELPEPWNNLASEYVRRDQLDLAEQALHMALSSNPGYATARLNLGIVQLRQAHASLQQAAAQGAPGARELADKTAHILP